MSTFKRMRLWVGKSTSLSLLSGASWRFATEGTCSKQVGIITPCKRLYHTFGSRTHTSCKHTLEAGYQLNGGACQHP